MRPLTRFLRSFSTFLDNPDGQGRSPVWLDTPVKRARRWWHDNQHAVQGTRGLLFLFLVFFIVVIVFPYFGGRLFNPEIVPAEVADRLRHINPFYKRFPVWLLYRFDWHIARFMIAPLAAIFIVLIQAARYVQNIYHLKSYGNALHYVLSSMFSAWFPILRIDNGRLDIPKGQENLLEAVGGPGFVVIEPGSVALFHKINETSEIPVTTGDFLEPFESVAQVADLEDQDGVIDNATSITNDGIRVRLNDIHYRYRILPPVVDGRTVQRSMDSPYPYDPAAILNITYNMSMSHDGPDPWSVAVQRILKSAISEQINRNTIDDLTAPRNGRERPRALIRSIMAMPKVRDALASVGAELLWIDVGHIDVVSGDIDEKRVEFWASDLEGEANKERAIGDARRLAMRELGRAEAQADMIASITKALEGVSIASGSKENLRTLLLVRTSQILDAMRDNDNDEPAREESK